MGSSRTTSDGLPSKFAPGRSVEGTSAKASASMTSSVSALRAERRRRVTTLPLLFAAQNTLPVNPTAPYPMPYAFSSARYSSSRRSSTNVPSALPNGSGVAAAPGAGDGSSTTVVMRADFSVPSPYVQPM